MIGGVCGGIARTLGVDTVIVRVIVAVLGVLGGAGFAAYVIAWILLPSDDGTSALQSKDGRRRASQWFLVVLLAIAIASLVDEWFPGNDNGVGFLVFLGIAALLWQAFGSDWYRRTNFQHTGDSATPGIRVSKSDDGNTVTMQTPAGTTVIKQERKSPLARITWNVIVVTLGVMIALNWADVTDISTHTMVTVSLALTAVGLLLSAFYGRARGLIVIGMVLTLLALPTNVDVNGGVGDRTWTPATVAEAASSQYELGIGSAKLDLRPLVSSMQSTEASYINARVGIGDLVVLIPYESTARFVIQASTSAGDITLPDRPKISGMDHDVTATIGSGAGPTITLYLNTGMGNLEVRYA